MSRRRILFAPEGITHHPYGRRVRRGISGLLAVLIVITGIALGATSASAAPPFQITGAWAPDTPDTIAAGDVATGIWRVTVNDDGQAPADDPVENVNFSITLANGTFAGLPSSCLTADVAPVSSIAKDGATLLCNLGTQRESGVVTVEAAVTAAAVVDGELAATATIADQTVDLDPLTIQQVDADTGATPTQEPADEQPADEQPADEPSEAPSDEQPAPEATQSPSTPGQDTASETPDSTTPGNDADATTETDPTPSDQESESASPTAAAADTNPTQATAPKANAKADTGDSAGTPRADADAAPVYEIEGQWVNPPATVARGNPVVAEWRVNINDSANPPSNDPVDNVTATFTVETAFFDEIPDMCLTEEDGVDPPSSISEDGMTLTCNVGTLTMGRAIVVQTSVVADGVTGEEIVIDGTSPSGETKELPPIPIRNTFAMDIYYGQNANAYRWDDPFDPHYVNIDIEWSLRLGKGSDPGPDEATYRLTLAAENGGTIGIGNHYDRYGAFPENWNVAGCTPFDGGRADGHPWSAPIPNQPPDKIASFVDECILTPVPGAPGQFDLTLRGINYDLLNTPTHDSSAANNNVGNPLPPNWDYIASGMLWFRVTTDEPGSVSLDSNEPTYTSTTGLTYTDPASDNVTNKSYTLPGGWAAAWYRPYTGSGGTSWDDTYRVAAGTTVAQETGNNGGLLDTPDDSVFANCLVFDTDYVTYVPFAADSPFPEVRGYSYDEDGAGIQVPLNNPPAIQYYTGGVPDPNAFNCGTGTWTTTQPADLSTVQAIKIEYPRSYYDDEGIAGIQLWEYTRINDDVPVGQDVWMFGSTLRGTGVWQGIGEPWDSRTTPTPTPGARYPSTNGRRDIVRIITAQPYIEKSAARATVTAGVPADFTLTYSANGQGIIPDSVDGYEIVDTLPVGMTYEPGSADPEPTVAMNAQGQQVLTWTLDGVTTNEPHELTYQAVPNSSIRPGTALTNTATSSYGGETSAPAEATVTTSTNGYTLIMKTADVAYIPNLDGDGTGSGSWTVAIESHDPLPQAFTDTIDILPYNGDQRGTSYSGSYTLDDVVVPAGATVYYTDADPATLSDDPSDPSGANGTAGDVTGNTVGWTTTKPENPTAIRVIGPELLSGDTFSFQVKISTDGVKGHDVLVNRAQARAEHTKLVMRTSAPLIVANYYDATLKKYVQDINGKWHDANQAGDFPAFHYGDTIPYRVVVTNIGEGTLTNLELDDDQQPELGAFHIDTLAPGESQSHEYSIKLGTSVSDSVINTACATADQPEDMEAPPELPCDPAGFDVTNYITEKTSDPEEDTAVGPGEVIDYTITVTQQGTVPADAVFSDDLTGILDDADYNGDVKASIGTATVNNGHIDWSGTIPVGGVAKVTYSVTVHDVDELESGGNGDLYNPVTSPGCVPQEGEFPDCTTDHKTGYYKYSKVSDPKPESTVSPGDKVTYTITVTHKGKAPIEDATVNDDMSEVLDDAGYNSDAKASSGTTSYAAPKLTWKGDLAVGQKVTITYTVTVTSTGDDQLANVVTSPDKRGFCDETVGCDTRHPKGRYVFAKTSDPAPGSTVDDGQVVTYTVTVSHKGKAAIPGATVTDNMTGVLDDASYNGDAKASFGTMSYAAPKLTWKGDLAVGQTVTITYSVTVNGAGDDRLANVVTSPDQRGSCDGNIGCDTAHVMAAFRLGGWDGGSNPPSDPYTPPSTGDGGLAWTGLPLWLLITTGTILLTAGAATVGMSNLTNRRRRRLTS